MATMDINMARSRYVDEPNVLTTFNTSYLIPLKVLKVIPNGHYRISAGTISRLPALKVPVMGKLFLEFFAFYVPFDLLDKKFEKFITEGHDNSYDEDAYGPGSNNPNPESVGASIVPDLNTPKLKKPGADGFEVFSGDLFNRLGLPIANSSANKRTKKYNADLLAALKSKYGDNDPRVEKEYKENKVRVVPSYIPNGKYNAYPCRGYHLIWNHSFRSKFLQSPKITDFGYRESDPSNYSLLRVNRSEDWFSRGFVTSQLNPVEIPLAGFDGDVIPVEADSRYAPVDNVVDLNDLSVSSVGRFEFSTYDSPDNGIKLMLQSGTTTPSFFTDNSLATRNSDLYYRGGLGLTGNGRLSGNGADIGSINPHITLSKAVNLNINDLRYAIGLSHISQKALYGTDMDTILKMNFNLVLPKTCLKAPLLFGYKRVPIEINEVTQTAPDNEGISNIGDVYGKSTTVNRLDDGSFIVQSYNYGYIYLMCCIRHESVYQYGIDPIFTENDKFDLFQPDLQGLSNIGIPKKYIYFTGNDGYDEAVFNFNEPFSELKHVPNVVNGQFSSDSDTPLDFYHLADIYNDVPSYDEDWIQDTTKDVLDRSLTITSTNADQVHFYLSFTFDRVLPMSDYFVGYDYI